MFSLWSPIFRFPLSGDVSQDIEPQLTTKIAGVPEIEAYVVRDVASYGRQLGRISEAVLELADAQHHDGPKVQALRDLVNEIDTVKHDRKGVLRQDAETALARLRDADKDAWRSLTRQPDD